MEATRRTTVSEVMAPAACGHGRSLIQIPTNQGLHRLVHGGIRVRYRAQENKPGRRVSEVTHRTGILANGFNSILTLQRLVAESKSVEGRVIHLAVPRSRSPYVQSLSASRLANIPSARRFVARLSRPKKRPRRSPTGPPSPTGREKDQAHMTRRRHYLSRRP